MSEQVVPEEYWLNDFLKEFGPLKPFKPIAYFDSVRDAIVFQTIDCSITEHQIGTIGVILLEDNHPEEGQEKYIGFTIEGVTVLMRNLILMGSSGLTPISELKLIDLLSEIFKKYPDPVTEEALAQFVPFLKKTELEIIFEES